MIIRLIPAAILALSFTTAIAFAQQAEPIDVTTIGPQVGTKVPPFSGTDQTGQPQSLSTAVGTRGTMLVFFRSADW